MIEAAMYVALGFCTAGLIGLAILPAFYRRAARLTEEALRAVNPTSYAEVRAAQDQERARHAVELRRVEKRLDSEREKAAKFQLETTRMRAEVEALKKSHQDTVSGLEAKIAAEASDQHAVDMLSSEVTNLKKKLSEAERALAESWTKSPEDKPDAKPADTEEDDGGWLPASGTMALATITGLEAEVAMLKAKLARYEPTVAGQMDAARSETAKTRLAELEAQLVDTESNYVSAQAEVTRLSLMLDAARFPENERQKHLDAKLEKLSDDAARYQADAAEKDRALQRITAQMAKLQKDLASVPALMDLRRDFRALAEKLTGQEAPDFRLSETTAPAKPTASLAARSASAAAGSVASGLGENAPSDGNTPKASSSEASASNEAGDEDQAPVQAQSKSANIANAAEALVSRIVASSRIKSKPDAETTSAGTGATQDSDRKTKATKQKKKDVA
ncbi:hypothetical protein [Roseibium aggregatum]|uniref:hypothetical protein n=1 Tax=Roseibium aggregatum TaxID=187304 RepID=UPI003A96BAF2